MGPCVACLLLLTRSWSSGRVVLEQVFTALCGELQTPTTLPLLRLTPNGAHHLGSNRDKYIMEPAATTAELLKWYEFLGQLFAVALMQAETVSAMGCPRWPRMPCCAPEWI